LVEMTDRIDPKTRSKVMGSVRSQGTRLEERFRCLLKESDFSGLIEQPKDIPGRPDWISSDRRVAIFIDSCFWHGCRWHLRMPKTNISYWREKLERNKRRDKQVNVLLKKQGWKVLRVWEHNLLQYSGRARLVRKLRTYLE